MPDDAAQRAGALEDRAGNAGAAEEVGRGDAGRAAADDRGFFACDRSRLLDRGHQRVIAVLCGNQLGFADPDGLIVEVAAAPAHAVVRADGAGNKGQRILLGDELQSFVVKPLSAQLDVFWNVLRDGAAALAGSYVAVDQRNRLTVFAGRQRLDGLDVVIVGTAGAAHFRDGLGIGAGKGLEFHAFNLFRHLCKTVVTAGLQNRGSHGDRPDTGRKELVAVEEFRAAGEGNLHFAAELHRDSAAHLNGQREQSAAGHIHFVIGQLATRGIHGEGIGELQAELQSMTVCQRLQTLKHRYGVLPLQVLVEMVIVKDDVIIAHGVENGAGVMVAEDRRVALDKGIDLFLGDQIGRNALNLIRRAAVQGGKRDAARDMRGDSRDEFLFLGEEFRQNLLAFPEDGRGGGVLHGFDVMVDLFALDARKVIADGHIEDEAVRVAVAPDLCHDLQCAPGFDVLVQRLTDFQLGGPLLVVAFVIRENAGARHAASQLLAVHLLHSFDFKEARPRHIGGNDVLRKLTVGAGGGAEGRLNFFTENRQRLRRISLIGLVDAKDLAGFCALSHNPAHQIAEGDGIHSFRHGKNLQILVF